MNPQQVNIFWKLDVPDAAKPGLTFWTFVFACCLALGGSPLQAAIVFITAIAMHSIDRQSKDA